MKKYPYSLHYKFDQTYWWSIARKDLIWRLMRKFTKKLPSQKVLEIGVGSGQTLKFLEDKEFKTYGVDISKEAIGAARAVRAGILKIASAENLPYPENFFDFTLALDVLEHLNGEDHALKELFRVGKKRGYCFVIVPAYNFLWSTRDEKLNHKRRYDKKILQKKMEKAGFKIQKISYANSFYFLPVAFWIISQKLFFKKVKIKTDLLLLPQPLNWLMIQLLKLENFFLNFINLPWGLSVIAIGRKDEE
jgi:SAM-dependent methyltransferase